ncbi:MAG: PilZ domain-containing protein [Vibrionaceae bacterium]
MNNDDYFSVKAELRINVEPLASNKNLPTVEEFLDEIPAEFQIASQCSHLDFKVQNELSKLHNDHPTLSQLLQIQNEKVNLLLGFLLNRTTNADPSIYTESFGASKLTVWSKMPFTAKSYVKIHLFLENPACAIYCYAQVDSSKKKNDLFFSELHYVLLQEEDKDVLIRAALYHQQKLLRLRSQAKKEPRP